MGAIPRMPGCHLGASQQTMAKPDELLR
jgi:hypothetical protein